MEEGQFREAESEEEQKALPFNFLAPGRQLTQGQNIADQKQQMVKSLGEENRTSLYSSCMAREGIKPSPHNLAMQGGATSY